MSGIIIYIIYMYLYVSSIGMITSYNPIFSILFMMNVLLLVALNLILLDIAYLGLIFIMIYVGAIVILFLFVIMMLPLKKIAHKSTIYLAISFYFLFFLFFLILKFINKFSLFSTSYFFLIKNNTYTLFDKNIFIMYDSTDNNNLLKIGDMIFNYYYIYLFIIGFILLIVMVGSIFLTNEQQGKFIRKQFNVSYRQSVINICNQYF